MSRPDFDLHPDGRRVAISSVAAETTRAMVYAQDKIVFWSGFFDYLRKKVVAKQ
jgi:hypothetical protein